MRSRQLPIVLVATALALPPINTSAQESTLGKVEFPTSARSQEAQAHFIRGVAALHSFWYPVALEEFRASTSLEPKFAMGYWGEAMAHNHPVWGDPQDTEAARKVLANINDSSNVTRREQVYFDAVLVLYGDSDKLIRDRAYADAMEKIYREYPDDLEAAAFYALALLGTVRSNALHDASSTRTRMKAAAIAQQVYRKEPNHPGAAHYIIHAFDDPDHAILALPAARHYAKIAPEAPHALHMPSHIFLQLGMWEEAAESNEASWAASKHWVERQGLPVSQRDHHSLHWLLYIYLQQGRYEQAEELISLMDRSLIEFPEDDARNLMYGTYTRALMAAEVIVETERWDSADKLLSSLKAVDVSESIADSSPYQAFIPLTRSPAVFARGLAAGNQGSSDAKKSIAELRAIREKLGESKIPFVTDMKPVLEIQAMQIVAVLAASKRDLDKAIETLRKSITLERSMPPPAGPPLLIKPSNELLGEILLRADSAEEALDAFTKSLLRHPGRVRSLLGAARAAAEHRDRKAAVGYYTEFLRNWQHADEQLLEVREARNYLTRARVGSK